MVQIYIYDILHLYKKLYKKWITIRSRITGQSSQSIASAY